MQKTSLFGGSKQAPEAFFGVAEKRDCLWWLAALKVSVGAVYARVQFFFEICIDCPVGEDHFRELSFLHDLALLNPDLLQFCTYYALVAQW